MSILHKVTRQIFETDEGRADLHKFVQMREHEGFKAYMEKYLNLYIGLMLEDMLSDKFTKLTPIEKDIQQRAYAAIHDLLTWILRPEAEARKLNLVRQHNINMSAYQKREAKKGEQ